MGNKLDHTSTSKLRGVLLDFSIADPADSPILDDQTVSDTLETGAFHLSDHLAFNITLAIPHVRVKFHAVKDQLRSVCLGSTRRRKQHIDIVGYIDTCVNRSELLFQVHRVW